MNHPLASLVGPLKYACQRDFAQLGIVKDLRTLMERTLAAASGVDARALNELRAALPHVDPPTPPEHRKAALRQVLGALKLSGVALPEELERVVVTGEINAVAAGFPRAPERAHVIEGELAAALPHRRVTPPQGMAATGRNTVPAWRSQEPVVSGPARAMEGGTSNRAVSAPVRTVDGGTPGRAMSARSGTAESPPRGARPAGPATTRGAASGPGGAPAREPMSRTGVGADPRKGLPPAEGAAPAEKAKRKKKAKAVGAEASRSEAKLLSIAPRSGPLSAPLKTLGKRLGPRLVAVLDKKGLRRTGDILFLLPRCYEDRRRLRTIAELIPGERGVTVGTVKTADFVPGRGGKRMFRAVVGDRSGSIAATYFNAGPWLKSRFSVGKQLVLSGEVRASMNGREMAHPELEPAEDLESTTSVHFHRIVPIYPGFERGEQRSFRELAARISEQHAHHLEEPLPADLRRRYHLMGLPDALRFIHFPPEDADLEALDAHQSPAHRRLAFDELFFLQLGMALKRQDVKAEEGIAFDVAPARLDKARAALPFELTGAQARVVGDLARDMARPEPMSRLVQGDVGSGKTAVALVAAMVALQDGYQVAVMAPTEILAEQHERTFRRILEPLGFRVGLVSAAGTAKHKRTVREGVASGELHLAVGTHALLEGGVSFQKLGLVVIDEQHRFGVLQRQTLMGKGVMPDVLVMTATPIPRTLAMTLYGDLDVSIIDQLPPGRTPITTRVFNNQYRARVYEAVAAELAKGHQAYVVYPLVEESEKLDLEDATQGATKLQGVFPTARVGLLHGRMKAEEKDAVMEAFREKQIQLLVCTTVVEVGVDVPNASVMVVESAERFGLSQLHQLRGRVGRGAAASFCFLVAGAARSWESTERLGVMERSSDGFVIAEKDLEIRGPGEFLGTRQSGLPELAVANLVRDGDLLSLAQVEARRIMDHDPKLQEPEHQGLVKALEERWEGRLALARVG
ncbi:ATP-dependent DNA helicase RecG [Corallococcus praedator]|uniref:ATP-dependent DNA helicase RecG n=1 Tax=Corallococcus praedator TaxID=2316724 RepID=A0ABX9QGK2_9BACT|nr:MULTISPECIES: ATP-dependent DNA helicase RecG [Corallococcus]RKH13085.1 ATP-dependent DNA helicase RecG [Corallococcus sp. CA047B]RKH32689.1 ATP-dependent DNA helicase RecG [Corallococcus sp. CA031C]RKI07365.1 ATP-dependent DNA helicase RecG [Corallococcus praedator]